ncbi:MAG: tetraacyldisaccharide 4'-kinase [Gammaproteobacteria bacterium]|nr:tetraacyldisaccharide 4'-kinase [Gammaproteobacteria bacterium]
MRAETEQKLSNIWYGGQDAPLWLRALSPLYRAGNRADRWWGLRKRPDDLAGACIVVVGNITVGGSGKTPLVIRLSRLLSEAGLKTGVISRGYGRKEKGLRLVSPASDPDVVGDEPLLIAQQAGVPVIVSRRRCEAARKLREKGIEVILSDDGLQHYRLPRDLEICVVDGSRGFGNGHLLPAGPLREPLDRLSTVDYVVVNGEPDRLPEELEAVRMTMHAGFLRSMENRQSWRLSQYAGCKVNAVAGIGNPGRFFDLLRHARIKVREHAFPDHHHFTRNDFKGMDPDLPILMTEKDAVKCRALGLKNAWYLSVDAVLPHDWEQELVARVQGRVAGGGEG